MAMSRFPLCSAVPLCRAGFGGLVVLALLSLGCAERPTEPEALAAYEEANDPGEPTNRALFEFNQGFDRNLLKPAAEAYRDYVPDGARTSIRNVLNNLRSPVVFANDLLQGKPGRAMETLMRATMNTIAGMGGLFDVAGGYGLERHGEDFGQTLAVWGVSEGPFVTLPIFGPSNPRDTVGLAVDGFIDPMRYVTNLPGGLARSAVDGIDRRSEAIEALDEVERTSVDFYATIRSLYRQRRADEIRDGEPSEIVPAPGIAKEMLEEAVTSSLPSDGDATPAQ